MLPALSLVTTVPRATGSQKLGVGLGASLSLLSPQLVASYLGNCGSQPPFPSLRCAHTLAGPGPQAWSSCAPPPLPAKLMLTSLGASARLATSSCCGDSTRAPRPGVCLDRRTDASPVLLPPGQGAAPAGAQPLSWALRHCRIYSLSAQLSRMPSGP